MTPPDDFIGWGEPGEAYARGVGLRAGSAVSTPFATPREPVWLRPVREGRHGTTAPAGLRRDADESPFRLFYNAGLQSDLADLPRAVTAIGVDLLITQGQVAFDGAGRITGVVPDGAPLDLLARKLRDRPANLFLDTGAFRLRERGGLTTELLTLYLDRAEALQAEMERRGCCTLLFVVPDVVGDASATVRLRGDRTIMGRYWHLASRGAYLMWPMQGTAFAGLDAQLGQLDEHLSALAGVWGGAPQGRVVIGVPSRAAALGPETVAYLARLVPLLGKGWRDTPISWWHFLGTSRSRQQAGRFTLGQLAAPVIAEYEKLSRALFAVPTAPILTSDSTRAVVKATGLHGRRSREEVLAEEAVAGLASGMGSAAPEPQIRLFR